MLARPRLAVVLTAVLASVAFGVGSAGATTAPSPTDTATATDTPSPDVTPSPSEVASGTVPAPSDSPAGSPSTNPTTPSDSPSSSGDPSTGTPSTAASPSSAGAPTLVPEPPSDGVAPPDGYVDGYLTLSSQLQDATLEVAVAKARLASADLAISAAMARQRRAQIDLVFARDEKKVSDADVTDVVRELYQNGDSGLTSIATVLTSGPDGFVERLYNARAMRNSANGIARSALDATSAMDVASVDLRTAEAQLTAAQADRAAASREVDSAALRLAAYDAQLATLGAVAPQVDVGPEGCPTTNVPATLRDGADVLGAAGLCSFAVKNAATPQAALAITWAFRHLGAAYACKGAGRMLPFRADCSSFVSRAYAEGAGLNTAGPTWAPSTRNMVPWDGVPLDPHYAYVSPATLRPGDLVLYDTCPQGGCPYKHVVMYLGSPDGQTAWMMHTNACGDIAKVETFWGFPTTGSHTFLVARRVMALPGETLIGLPQVPPTTAGDVPAAPLPGSSGSIS